MNQKLIARNKPKEFTEAVNKHLDDGWHVVPGTHVGSFTNVATGRLDMVSSETGYFAIVVERDS